MVTIYSEDLEDDLVNGFIIAVSDTEMVLACVDRFGENDGFLLLKIDGVYRIDYESDYENRLKYLYLSKGQKHEKMDFLKGQENLKFELMQWAYKEEKAISVTFWDSDSEICGYIKDLKKFQIQKIDKYSCKPGQGSTYISLENVRCIWADERRARDSGMVYKMRG